MTTTLKKIASKILPTSEAERDASKQLTDLRTQIARDKEEAVALGKDVAGWKKELDAIHEKGWAVTVADGEAAQALMGKIDVAEMRQNAIGFAQAAYEVQISAIASRFPRLHSVPA